MRVIMPPLFRSFSPFSIAGMLVDLFVNMLWSPLGSHPKLNVMQDTVPSSNTSSISLWLFRSTSVREVMPCSSSSFFVLSTASCCMSNAVTCPVSPTSSARKRASLPLPAVASMHKSPGWTRSLIILCIMLSALKCFLGSMLSSVNFKYLNNYITFSPVCKPERLRVLFFAAY